MKSIQLLAVAVAIRHGALAQQNPAAYALAKGNINSWPVIPVAAAKRFTGLSFQ
jgi:hypothetical protein